MLRPEARSINVDVLVTAAVTAMLFLDPRVREQPLFALLAVAAIAVELVAGRRGDESGRIVGELTNAAFLLVIVATAPIATPAAAGLAFAVSVRSGSSFGPAAAAVIPLVALGALTIHGLQASEAPWIAIALAAIAVTMQKRDARTALTPPNTVTRDDREDRLAWQRRFVSMVSHDIRAPLATIRGAAALLRDHYEHFDAERREEFLDTLMDGTEHLRILVDDLLLMSQIEAGRLLIERTPVDLSEAMRESSHAVLARDPSRTIDVVSQSQLPPIYADAVRLRQILTNLLGNALKYSIAGSEVIVVLAADGEGVRCTVYNEGAGISAEEQPKVFTPYATLSTRSADSTGLGLYIAKELVDAMGGRIGFDSQPGQNAAFWFWLPFATSTRVSAQYAEIAVA